MHLAHSNKRLIVKISMKYLLKIFEDGVYMLPRITLVQQFEQQQAETLDLTFSSDGKQLTSSDGSALYLWRLNEGRNWSYDRSLPFRYVAFLHCVHNEKVLALVGEEEFLKLVSLDGSDVATFPRPAHAVWAFSPDLRWCVSSDSESSILLWDLTSNQSFSVPIPIPAFDRSKENAVQLNTSVGRFLFTPDGQQLVLFADSLEGSLHVCSFDPEHRRIMRQKTFPTGMIDGVISPDGKMFAIIVPNEQMNIYKQDIYIYDLRLLQLMHIFLPTTGAFYCRLAFSPDSQYLASCKSDGLVDIFSLGSFECVASFAAHPGLSSHATDPIGGLAWSRTGYIATGGASEFKNDMKKTDYTIKLWKVEEE